MTNEELVQEIRKAFADVQYPGDDNLVIGETWEPWNVGNKLRGKHWSELSDELVFDLRFNLVNLTLEAYHYYLPAYLITSLVGHNGGEITEFIIYTLTPPEEQGSKMDEFLNRVQGFTPQQRAVLKVYVVHFTDLVMRILNHLMPWDERAKAFWDTY